VRYSAGLAIGNAVADREHLDLLDQYFFDNQSDDIPEPLNLPGGNINAQPIQQGAKGAITTFPDHMHEGKSSLPGP
jgi:hypothetical protein